jgi:hypothetical protein
LGLDLMRIPGDDLLKNPLGTIDAIFDQVQAGPAQQHQRIFRHGPQARVDQVGIVDHHGIDPADHQQPVPAALAGQQQGLRVRQRLPCPTFDLQ